MGTILVVDDEPHMTRLTKTRLEREGYEVVVAHDGEEALERASARSFDAIVTDMQMPRMDGRELCEAVRKLGLERDPFILVVTSCAEDDLRVWAKQVPNLDFMEKPVSLNRLATRVKAALSLQAVADAAAREQQ